MMKGYYSSSLSDFRYHPDCLAPSFKSKRTSIMVWACFAGSTLGELISYPKGGINAQEYINTLQIGLLPFIIKLNLVQINENDVIQVATMGDFVFMHDNAPIHRARATEVFLEHYHINVMWWPANSPDLNPIEHLWHHMKIGFHEEFFDARNIVPSRSEDAMQAYIEGLKQVWNEKLGDLPQRLVASMPRRVAAVIEAKGGHTKY